MRNTISVSYDVYVSISFDMHKPVRHDYAIRNLGMKTSD